MPGMCHRAVLIVRRAVQISEWETRLHQNRGEKDMKSAVAMQLREDIGLCVPEFLGDLRKHMLPKSDQKRHTRDRRKDPATQPECHLSVTQSRHQPHRGQQTKQSCENDPRHQMLEEKCGESPQDDD